MNELARTVHEIVVNGASSEARLTSEARAAVGAVRELLHRSPEELRRVMATVADPDEWWYAVEADASPA